MMNEYNTFTSPEKPFLLIYTNEENELSCSWLESEEELMDVITEVTSYGCKIQDAIEIGSVRCIDFNSNFRLNGV